MLLKLDIVLFSTDTGSSRCIINQPDSSTMPSDFKPKVVVIIKLYYYF